MAKNNKEPSAPLALPDNLPKPGSTITRSQAIEIAQQIANQKMRAEKNERKAARAAVEREVGHIGTKVDAETIAMTKRLMTRIAMIAQKAKANHVRSYNGNGTSTPAPGAGLDGIVLKLAAIAGQLEAIVLTDHTIGLFEQVAENDYVAAEWQLREVANNPGAAFSVGRVVGKRAKVAVEEILDQYTIVADPKEPKATALPAKRGRNVTPTSTARAIAEADEEARREQDAAALAEADAEAEAANNDADGAE